MIASLLHRPDRAAIQARVLGKRTQQTSLQKFSRSSLLIGQFAHQKHEHRPLDFNTVFVMVWREDANACFHHVHGTLLFSSHSYNAYAIKSNRIQQAVTNLLAHARSVFNDVINEIHLLRERAIYFAQEQLTVVACRRWAFLGMWKVRGSSLGRHTTKCNFSPVLAPPIIFFKTPPQS